MLLLAGGVVSFQELFPLKPTCRFTDRTWAPGDPASQRWFVPSGLRRFNSISSIASGVRGSFPTGMSFRITLTVGGAPAIRKASEALEVLAREWIMLSIRGFKFCWLSMASNGQLSGSASACYFSLLLRMPGPPRNREGRVAFLHHGPSS